MIITDAVDYTGTGVAVTLASVLGLSAATSAMAKWFQISVVTQTTSTFARVGSSSITTGRGIPILGGQFVPPISEQTTSYDLRNIYILVQATDIVSVAYAI